MPRPPADQRSSRIVKQSKRFSAVARALGLAVRQQRQAQALTLEQGSALMDVDLKHLQKIEAGKLNVTLVTLLRISDGLGVPMDELFRLVPKRKGR